MKWCLHGNSTASQEGTGSSNDRFLSRMPNSINPEIKSVELINVREEKHDDRIKGKNRTNKILYEVGQRVRLQNVVSKDWSLKGTIDLLRTTDDGRLVSYAIITDKGYCAAITAHVCCLYIQTS